VGLCGGSLAVLVGLLNIEFLNLLKSS
jgi:hypothetical protein